MDRLVLLVIACTAQVGCQAPTTGFDPFAFGRQTRVPAPPTNAIGNSGTPYLRPDPLPPVDSGAATRPRTNYGSGRYWEAAPVSDSRSATDTNRLTPSTPPRASGLAKNVELTRNDRLTWLDPDTKGIPGPLPVYGEEWVVSNPSNAPRLLPPHSGPVESLASRGYTRQPEATPVRIRNFRNAGTQQVRIPAELAEFQSNDGVRQAARWQPRYDDIRR